MADQENLFATPARPKILRISVERAWSVGEDVWDLSMAVHGSKGQGPAWATAVRYEGPEAAAASSAMLDACVWRFAASRWDREPTCPTVEQWEAQHRL